MKIFDKEYEIDFTKLHKALSDTYKRQMEIKKEFPHRFSYPQWTYEKAKSGKYKEEMEARRPWQKARSEFNQLSDRMTMLCCIINHAKGKLHMKSYLDEPFTMENQESFIVPAYKEFVVDDTDEFGVSEADEKIVDEFINSKKPAPKQGLVARFAKALGL